MKNETFNFTEKKFLSGTVKPNVVAHKQNNHGTKECSVKTVNCCTVCSHDLFCRFYPATMCQGWEKLK
jgi:hypothetical protein